ncbi:two-component system response regulator RppA [Leptolyngbya sp. FACHB-261]|uniref:two-component system response regulator RppA n=1 Tax=Leptolyngbya sp. FACHB-261 TaxID=2692806 RepID=UPI0016886D9F|nr:two-component system response regulator RppA [Leptolyngbya sp. FACHB-261]MBD2103065.1 response regulator transcription factor [Leptolyngbya sp. FACHB-261]
MRVLLVEDEPDLAHALKEALEHAGYVVDLALDGEDACAYLLTEPIPYSLAVLDWMLPGVSGLELCQLLRSKGNALPVLMLTAKDRLTDKITGLDAGADDYLIKPFDIPELLARLRALLRRPPQLQSHQLKVGELELDYNTHSVQQQGEAISLTLKEFQLLEYFMQHPNQVLSSEQIRRRLWETGVEPTSNIVAAQVRLLRRKLTSQGHKPPIETVFGVGYRLNSSRSGVPD